MVLLPYCTIYHFGNGHSVHQLNAKTAQNRDRVRKSREKVSAQELDEKRRKDIERYKRKNQAGLLRLLINVQVKKAERRNWVKASANYRKRLKDKKLVTQFSEASTPPQLDNEDYGPMVPTPGSSKRLSRRKRVKYDRSMVYRRLRKVEAENKKAAIILRSISSRTRFELEF
ncbi:hypothetical protein ILUMI_07950, partial [Ignelater luminosus]